MNEQADRGSVQPIHALAFSTFDQALDSKSRVEDLSGLTFIDSYGLVGLTITLIDACRSEDPVVVVPPKNSDIRRHLVHMGLRRVLDEIGGLDFDLPDADVIERPDVLVPLQFLRTNRDVETLSDLLWQQLRQDADPQVLTAMSEGLWEIAANALEHSGQPAIAMGQVYSRESKQPDHSRTVQISIGDTGCGIRRSFLGTDKYSPGSDHDALDLALEYLVSSVDDPGRGQGIATTREQTVGLRGAFSIRSGSARFLDRDGVASMTTVPQLPGTMVGMVIPLRPGSTT